MATTGRLTADQRTAIQAGAPIVQRWAILVPTSSTHAAYTEYEIDSGAFNGPDSLARVIRAGRRTHELWNPTPNVKTKPKAVVYNFTVSNADGHFYETHADNVYQIPAGYQAIPQECIIKHQIFVLVAGIRSEISHMTFHGRITDLKHEGIADSEGNPIPVATIIRTEQKGAWEDISRVWTIDDATDHPMTNDEPGGLDYTWTVT